MSFPIKKSLCLEWSRFGFIVMSSLIMQGVFGLGVRGLVVVLGFPIQQKPGYRTQLSIPMFSSTIFPIPTSCRVSMLQ